MGKIISKFKKKEKSTYQKLELLEERIRSIEEYTGKYQQKEKRFVGNLLLYGVGLSIIAFLVYFFAFLPETLEKRIIHSIPLLIFPFLIFCLKCLVGWYYQRRMSNNSEQLSDLRMEKKQLIEQVMNKETYKVALDILNRFGGNYERSQMISPIKPTTPLNNTVKNNSKVMVTTSTNMTPSGFKTPAPVARLNNIQANITTLQQRLNTTPLNSQNRSMSTPSSPAHVVSNRSNKPTPYPIIDSSNKNVVDKMVDYLIGDGPSNRFAMICQDCYKHNGMALQEDYEYAAFRCAFCNYFNPAKKLRPAPPRLPIDMQRSPQIKLHQPSNSTPSSSDTDSDISIEKPSSEYEKQSNKSDNNDVGSKDLSNNEESPDTDENVNHPQKPFIEKKLE